MSDGTVSCTSGTCTWQYSSIDTASPVATPAGGYSFRGWGGACSGTGTCSIAMNADKAVSAAFADITAPPPPTITSPADSAPPPSGSAQTISFTRSDGGGATGTSGFRCRIDNASVSGATACTSPWSTGALATGSHTVYVWAVDPAGNISGYAARNFKIVNRPDTTIGGTPAEGSLVNSTTTAFTYSSSVGGASYECTLDGNPVACNANVAAGEGAHTLAVAAGISPFGDGVFYYDTTPATRHWTVDTTRPVSTITGGPGDGEVTDARGATFTFTQADAHPGRFQCSYDGALFADCPGGVAGEARYDSVAVGSHTFAVEAVDAAGNVESTPVSRSWTVTGADGVIVAPAIGAPAAGADPIVSADGAVTVTFASDDPDTHGFACEVDGDGSPQPCTSPWTTHLTTGAHTVYVHGVNGAARGAAATRTFRVVRRPDTTLGGTPAAGAISGSSATALSYASTAAGATLNCTLDGHPVPCTANVGPLADGTHTITVRSGISPFDPDVTYWDSTPATRTFVVDTHPPGTTITGGPASATTDRAARLSFAGSDPSPGTALHYECRLDGGRWAPCASGASYSGLATGRHSLAVRAVDAAGNADATPAAWTWMVIADADRDGFFTPSDCDDADAAVHPGARDVAGDGIDQDCSGADAPPKKAPAKLRARWTVHGATTAVRALTLTRLAKHAEVALTCRGRGCPFKAHEAKVRHGSAQLTTLFRRHALRKGTRLVLRVTAPGTKARTIRITIRSGHTPKVAGA